MGTTADVPWDVVIIGGGPGGSTTGTLLKKYAPELRVLILEREQFPREHIGESQLPDISKVLDEMGVWDKVEAANFPIKIGATYRWGLDPELWDFEFLPLTDFKDEPRPAKYGGQRRQTAFQVERAIYDDILLRHAEEFGCAVRQPTAVDEVLREADRVTGLRLRGGETVTARWYVDASGNAAILRRALNVPVDCPTKLKNIAIWDYWENAEWAAEIGVGGTRIQILSLGYGWLWFIPLGPTRTSLGLVCPVEYYKSCGKSPEELYRESVARSERLSKLVANGTRSGKVRTTNDWSFLAERTFGDNWFLVGECAGFADPILSAGLTLTQVGARELAYTLIALHRGEHDPAWLKHHFNANQLRRVRQHIRFADFWYAANGQFTDLSEHCRDIARDSGLNLNARDAWAWIAQGGFTNDVVGQAGIGGLTLAAVKHVTQLFTAEDMPWLASGKNVFCLRFDGAVRETIPIFQNGAIIAADCYFRGGLRLPITGLYELLVQVLTRSSDIQVIVGLLLQTVKAQMPPQLVQTTFAQIMQALEVMVSEGWVEASLDPTRPQLNLATPRDGSIIHTHREEDDHPGRR